MPARPLVFNPAGKVFQALACDLRLRILNAVESGHVSTHKLAAALDAPTSTISKATTVLVHAGLLAKAHRHPGDDLRDRHLLFVTPLARDLISRVLREQDTLAALRADRQVVA
jgi:DNA-binding transcriptional ArsR family regulator